MDFVCPKCKRELVVIDGRVKRCALGHSFDRAKEGYYNLLLGAGGGTHGDNIEMVRARRAFLSSGYYYPMAKRVAELVLEYTDGDGAVLDSGLGEGYYTDIIEKAIFECYKTSNVLGFDISKEAVKSAAKRNGRISLAVASSYDIPLASASIDTAVNVFSPLAKEEMKRVLKCGGTFIMVYPDKEHLWGFKKTIYEKPYKNMTADTELDGFSLVKHETVKYNITLEDNDAVRALFMMTPYAYRTGREEREKVFSLNSITTQVEFCIAVYRKSKAEAL